jgi:hypothetical protein
MTPAERTADRIAKNKLIAARAAAIEAARQKIKATRNDAKAKALTLELHQSLLETTGEGLPPELLNWALRNIFK